MSLPASTRLRGRSPFGAAKARQSIVIREAIFMDAQVIGEPKRRRSSNGYARA
jgi:hypothetical protein